MEGGDGERVTSRRMKEGARRAAVRRGGGLGGDAKEEELVER